MDNESHWTQEERDNVASYLKHRVPKLPILRFFEFAHLPTKLADVSFTFARQAAFIVENTHGTCFEQAVALRRLLESKDAAVRAALPPDSA